MVRLFGVKWVAVAMKKRVRRGFCCCRSCKDIFGSEADFLSHLSCDGYCRGGGVIGLFVRLV